MKQDKLAFIISALALVLVFASVGWGSNVCYSVCPGGPEDFKTGSPTITISGDTATFSTSQIHSLMGDGAYITYATTKKCIVNFCGKISTTQWRVTKLTGGNPDTVINNTVNSIRHIWASLSSATASTGIAGAVYLNATDLTAIDVRLYIACYAEQTTFLKDSATVAIVTFTCDSARNVNIYSPTNTTTQCNLSMFPLSAKFDSTKYYLKNATSNPIAKYNTSSFVRYHNLQLWNATTNSTSFGAIKILTISGETTWIDGCILISSGPASTVTGQKYGIWHQGTSAGTVVATNNIIMCLKCEGTNSGPAIWNSAGNFTGYSNTVKGLFVRSVLRSAGTVVLSNNIFDCLAATSGTITKDYDVYRTADEGEANGFLTTQTAGQLFADTTPVSPLNWDWTPIAGSELIGKGTTLAAIYDGDIFHANGSAWRPIGATWDAGAMEYKPTIDITSIVHTAGDHYTINGTGFKPAATCPTVTTGGTSATVDSCSSSLVYITLGGAALRGNRVFSVTNSNAENDTLTGYIYTYPVLASVTRIYGAKYIIKGTGLKPSTVPTITIGAITAAIDTSWSDSVKLTLGPLTPRGTQNLILINSDAYKDTISMTVAIGDHAINIFCIGQSNMVGTDTGTHLDGAANSYKWDEEANVWVNPASDPQRDGVGNTCIPELSDHLSGEYTDIGFIPGAAAGNGVVDWITSRDNSNPFLVTTIYGRAITWARNAGGFDHIIHWGGESDCGDGISSDSLARAFRQLVRYLKQDLVGYMTDPCPIAFLSPNGGADTNNQKIRDGFSSLHNPDSGLYLAGHALFLGTYDGLHTDEIGLTKAAWMFYRTIKYANGNIDYCLGPRFKSRHYGLTKDTVIFTITKDSPVLLPALGAKGFRVQNGADTIIVNQVDIADDEIKLSLASPITELFPRIGYQNKSPHPLDSLVHYNDTLTAYLEPTSRDFEVAFDSVSKTPASGPVGTTVTFTGSGFIAPCWVKFGTDSSTLTVVSYTSATKAVPALAPGVYAVSVGNSDGDQASVGNFTVTGAGGSTRNKKYRFSTDDFRF